LSLAEKLIVIGQRLTQPAQDMVVPAVWHQRTVVEQAIILVLIAKDISNILLLITITTCTSALYKVFPLSLRPSASQPGTRHHL
jgi:hypothetical protein